MKANKITKLFLVIGLMTVFFLNGSVSIATARPDYDAGVQGAQPKQIVSKNEEAIQKGFVDAKEWLRKETQAFLQTLEESFAKIKEEINQWLAELKVKLEELTNRHYTQMKVDTGGDRGRQFGEII